MSAPEGNIFVFPRFEEKQNYLPLEKTLSVLLCNKNEKSTLIPQMCFKTQSKKFHGVLLRQDLHETCLITDLSNNL